MMRRRVLSVSFFLLATTGLFAQNGGNGVFAPFVSRLNAAVEAGRILLSWKNSEDLNGYKRIYRSEAEITDQTAASAVVIARVAPDAESYIDTPPVGRDYFYAVLVEDRNGDPYRVFIPFRNKTMAGVRLDDTAAAVAAVTGITAAAVGDAIMVSFLTSNTSRGLILYRSTTPLRTAADLTQATYSIRLNPGTVQVKDIPMPGIDYYYAVLDAELVNVGRVQLTAGQNTTAAPVRIPLADRWDVNPALSARVYPLPAPHILYSIDTNEELLPPLPFLLPPRTELTETVRDRVDSLIERISRPIEAPAVEILPVDEAPNLEGEDLLLQTIAKGLLASPDAKETSDKLDEFLKNAHADRIEARARFYLGQSYFRQGRIREALRQFIFSRKYYNVETQKWIDACLAALAAVK